LCARFGQADGLPFADVLTAERIDGALAAAGGGWRDCVWTPALTLWAFLGQVLAADASCRAAVARALAWLLGRGQPPCSPKTDPYCKARYRLPEESLRLLLRDTGDQLHRQLPDGWRWKGRRVKLVDGSTVSMPDTPANQKAYPQQADIPAGLGFPLARLVVVFCLACGAALEAALGPYQGKGTGESSLFRALWERFSPGDVVVGDRYYSSWWDLALLQRRGVAAVFRLHHRRRADFRRGRRLGREDHVVRWRKPQRPGWLDEADYAALPAQLAVREVRVRVAQPGFRCRALVVVTTLLDPAAVTAADLAQLYQARWHAELDLRSLKVTLGMDVLRGQSPATVRKEVWAHLLAYNLIRTVMAQAAREHGLEPRQLSFTGALQTAAAFAEALGRASAGELPRLYATLLRAVAAHRVGDRPDRVEPRVWKRRGKAYPLLKEPRQKARTRLGTKS
jgi:hypothetical protein